MKWITAPVVALLASPALAHDGLHLHPHGSETILTGLAVIATLGTLYLASRR